MSSTLSERTPGGKTVEGQIQRSSFFIEAMKFLRPPHPRGTNEKARRRYSDFGSLTSLPPSPVDLDHGLAFWESVTRNRSATVPDSHGIPWRRDHLSPGSVSLAGTGSDLTKNRRKVDHR